MLLELREPWLIKTYKKQASKQWYTQTNGAAHAREAELVWFTWGRRRQTMGTSHTWMIPGQGVKLYQ
jgi:hypothetical protein